MKKQLQKIRVKIKQNDSPAHFFVEYENGADKPEFGVDQNHSSDWNSNKNESGIKRNTEHEKDETNKNGPNVLKCHLAFIAPTNSCSWSLSAIDKFIEYTNRFNELAITIPTVVSSATETTGVILWGSMGQEKTTQETERIWQNINLQMIFQAVVRSTIDLNLFNHHSEDRIDFEEHLTNKNMFRWPAAEKCFYPEFFGIPMGIGSDLSIYVQDPNQQKQVRNISDELANMWRQSNTNRKISFKKWDLCIAKHENGCFYRAKIKAVDKRLQKCLVQFVDFGSEAQMDFKNLSKKIVFKNIPIQVHKCCLLNITCSTPEKVAIFMQIYQKSILNQTCKFYIHENLDVLHRNSVICTIQPWYVKFDVASALISYGAAMKMTSSQREIINESKKAEIRFHLDKRIRRISDEPILKASSDLKSLEDFVEFYETNKTVIPPIKEIDDTAEDQRKFELFDLPRKRNPWNDKRAPDLMIADRISCEPHPILKHIGQHFRPLQINEPVFYCQTLYVIDPITILVRPEINASPPEIKEPQNKNYDGILPDHSPCIAFLDNKWHRGIIWLRVSSSKYHVLFIDTLRISEIRRRHIQRCPKELLHTHVQFVKAYLSQIRPNKRMRSQDVCNELMTFLLDEKRSTLCAKVKRIWHDGNPEVKLYMPNDLNKSIFTELVSSNFYKKINGSKQT